MTLVPLSPEQLEFKERMHREGPPGYQPCTRSWPHAGPCAHRRSRTKVPVIEVTATGALSTETCIACGIPQGDEQSGDLWEVSVGSRINGNSGSETAVTGMLLCHECRGILYGELAPSL